MYNNSIVNEKEIKMFKTVTKADLRAITEKQLAEFLKRGGQVQSVPAKKVSKQVRTWKRG